MGSPHLDGIGHPRIPASIITNHCHQSPLIINTGLGFPQRNDTFKEWVVRLDMCEKNYNCLLCLLPSPSTHPQCKMNQIYYLSGSLKHSKKVGGLSCIPRSSCDFLLRCWKADYDVDGEEGFRVPVSRESGLGVPQQCQTHCASLHFSFECMLLD